MADSRERSPDLLRPIIAAKDVAEDEGDRRRQIAEAVLDSFAPQLDLFFAAAIYGLVGLFLGSLIGELLVASLLPRLASPDEGKPGGLMPVEGAQKPMWRATERPFLFGGTDLLSRGRAGPERSNGGSRKMLSPTGDRWFESISLQR